MKRVTSKERTVFRHGENDRWFLTAAGAYYDLAKILMLRRYPREVVANECPDVPNPCDRYESGLRRPTKADSLPDWSEGHGDMYADELEALADWNGLTRDQAVARRARARDLFWTEGGRSYDGEIEHEYFDQDRWKRYVKRIADRLRRHDERERARSEAST